MALTTGVCQQEAQAALDIPQVYRIEMGIVTVDAEQTVTTAQSYVVQQSKQAPEGNDRWGLVRAAALAHCGNSPNDTRPFPAA